MIVGIAALTATAFALTTTVGILALAIGALSAPVAIAIAAITALGVAGVALWAHWDTVKAKAEELSAKLIATFDNLVAGAKDWGINLVTGIWNGINDKILWIKGKVEGFADSISTTFKTFFGIRSPSRLMAEYGANPIGKGNEQTKKAAIKAVEILRIVAPSIYKGGRMTLVLSMVQKDFVVMTSDPSRVVYKYYYLEDLQPVDDQESTSNEKAEKVFKLTDRVLIGLGGTKEIALEVLYEMQKRIKPTYDLKKCGQVLGKIISELRGRSLHGRFLNKEDGLVVLLNGFYFNGRTGQLSFESGTETEVEETICPNQRYLYAIIPPYDDYKRLASSLFSIGDKPRNVDTFAAHVTGIHTTLSYLHPERISSDCGLFVLHRDTGKPLFIQAGYKRHRLFMTRCHRKRYWSKN